MRKPYSNLLLWLFSLAAIFLLPPSGLAQVPHLLNYQGRVAVGSVNFEGAGLFKFALVNTDGSATYWSNDGSSDAGSEPAAAVMLPVTKGLYSVLLGDTSLANMTAIPASVFTHPDVRLRVWFNDGTNGSQLLTPDQRLAPNGYLPDGVVSSSKLADGSIISSKIANGAVGGAQLASGSVGSSQLGSNLMLSGITTGTFSGNGAEITGVRLEKVSSGGAIAFGSFVHSSSPATGFLPYSIVATDINGDDLVDVISANFNGSTLSVLTNNGSGGFTLSSSQADGYALFLGALQDHENFQLSFFLDPGALYLTHEPPLVFFRRIASSTERSASALSLSWSSCLRA